MIKIVLPLLCLCLFAFSACDEKPRVVEEAVYKQLMLEFTILNQMEDDYFTNTSREEIREKILERHSTTAERFRESHEYYQQNIPEQLDRMEQIGIRLREERNAIQKAIEEQNQKNREPADSLRREISTIDPEDE